MNSFSFSKPSLPCGSLSYSAVSMTGFELARLSNYCMYFSGSKYFWCGCLCTALLFSPFYFLFFYAANNCRPLFPFYCTTFISSFASSLTSSFISSFCSSWRWWIWSFASFSSSCIFLSCCYSSYTASITCCCWAVSVCCFVCFFWAFFGIL